MTELRPLSAIKLTWTACDIVGHVANCQVSVACDELVCVITVVSTCVQPFVGAFSWVVYKESQQDNMSSTQAPVTVTPKKKYVCACFRIRCIYFVNLSSSLEAKYKGIHIAIKRIKT